MLIILYITYTKSNGFVSKLLSAVGFHCGWSLTGVRYAVDLTRAIGKKKPPTQGPAVSKFSSLQWRGTRGLSISLAKSPHR